MIRLFTAAKLSIGQHVYANENQVHYLFHVMRLKVGDKVLLFNGLDGEFECEIIDLNKKAGVFMPLAQTREQSVENGPVLAMSLIKKDNMDLVLQKATELGVSEIVPIVARRSVLQKMNRQRAEVIVTEAAEQCERLSIPKISEPMDVNTFLSTCRADEKIVYLSERGQTNGTVKRGEKVCFAIGPEGGWTAEELNAFKNHQAAVALNLGRLILRAETAAISVLAAYRFDVFGE